MRSSIVIDQLAKNHIEALQGKVKTSTYQVESTLIYEGHSPTAGYLLLDGEISFLKRKKVVQRISAGTLFGVTELMKNAPVKYSVHIESNSKVLILDKSTVKELLSELHQEDLPHIFRSLVA